MIALKKHFFRRCLIILCILGILVYMLSAYGQPLNDLHLGVIEFSFSHPPIVFLRTKISSFLVDVSCIPDKVLHVYDLAKQQFLTTILNSN